MKSVLITLLVATALVACGKKEQPAAPAKEDVTTKQDAQNVPSATPAASEPAKTEEVKK